MLKLEKYDGTKTYMFPNGDIATPERIEADFPAVTVFPHILEVNGDVCQAVMSLSAMRERNNIDPLLTETEAIIALQTIINTPPPEPEPSPEERMAASMEYDNLMKY